MREQERARDRHERILDAALRVFARKGYKDAAVDDIVAESKTSKGGVYFHFPGKQAIFLELLDRTAVRLRQKIEEAIASRDDPIEKADAALLAVFNTFASHRSLARLFMIEALGAGREFHRRMSQLHEEFAMIIKVHLDDAVAAGAIDAVDTEVAARAWFGGLNQVLTSWVLSGKPARVGDAYGALRPLLMRSVGARQPGAPKPGLSPELSHTLTQAIEAGKERSGRSGEPVIVSAIMPWKPFDLLGLLDRATAAPRVAWDQPSDGFSFVALGSLSTSAFDGSARFAGLAAEWQRLRSSLLVAGDPDITQLPVALAGMAFDHERRAQEAGVMPDALLLLPRLVFIKTGMLFWLRANVIVDAATDAERAAGSILSKAVALMADASDSESDGCGLDFADETPRQDWLGAVDDILAEIESGQVEKVVLARRLVAETASRPALAAALRRLSARYPSCTTFAFDLGDVCFLGATPERLVRLDGPRVYVDCLAGSTARGATPAEDARLGEALLADPKEHHEHEVVVRELLEQVRDAGDEVVTADEPVLRRFSNIQHLYTPITAVATPGTCIIDLVQRLHPTPATCGRPRDVALDSIRRHEGFDRSWYAGPVGWLDAEGGGDFVVGLRSALIEPGAVALYGGSGIVSGSVPEREHEESTLKMKVMSWALQPES